MIGIIIIVRETLCRSFLRRSTFRTRRVRWCLNIYSSLKHIQVPTVHVAREYEQEREWIIQTTTTELTN